MENNLYPSASRYHNLFVEPNSNIARQFGNEHSQEVDTLLAKAGYSVKTSELVHVAKRLEQLESVLYAAQEAGISHLSSGAIHYNPSDLASWVETMIGELVPTATINADYCTDPGSTSNSAITSVDYNQAIHEAQFKQELHAGGSLPLHENQAVSSYGFSCYEDLEEFDNQLKDVEKDEQMYPNNPDPGKYACAPYDARLHKGHTDVSGFHSSNLAAASNLQHTMDPYPLYQPRPTIRLESGVDKSTQYTPIIKHERHHRSGIFLGSPCQSNSMLPPDDLQCPNQERGVRLVHLLMACAHAIQNHELKLAHEIVSEIQALAYPHTSGAMAKVAAFFMEGLARRIYSLTSLQECQQVQQGQAISDLLYYHFYEICPYLKFAHFTANQAILEAFQGQKYVHVIDFSLMQGLQWPALIQALALRPGGPPHLRLTGIGPPQLNNKDVLRETGMKIAQFADSVNVGFDFRGIVAANLDDVKPWMFRVQQGETVAVNSVLQLHRLLPPAEDSAHTLLPIDEVLQSVKCLKPKVLTVVEQEAEHNGVIFEERFMHALQYYCTMFDSLEACKLAFQANEIALAEMYLGKEIVNIVACEGKSRVERHETLCQWRKRLEDAGFRPLLLGSNAFKQARMLLNLFSGEGYTIQEDHGCLSLGWQSLPLMSASSWQCD
eukprot:c23715_g1_i1 orf=499-2493(+)